MDLDILIEFGQVAKHGNLSEAARELSITQPALSRHLAQLEKEMGVKLFDRSYNPMELTPAGEIFLEKMHSVTSEYFRLRSFMNSIKDRSFLTIRIGGLIDPIIMSAIYHAKRELEDVDISKRIRIVPVEFQTSFNMVRENSLDIAIEPDSKMDDMFNLESTFLFCERACVVVEKGHHIAACSSVTPKDLISLEVTSLRSNKDFGIRRFLQSICRDIGFEGGIPKSLSLTASMSYDELFIKGIGDQAVFLPESIALRYASDSGDSLYTALFFDDDITQFRYYAYYSNQANEEIKTFVDLIKKALSDDHGLGESSD
ncbi:MAG: LysR family transcriptional regulator [Eggerthellaceae bacterium]|nr:LysR family transcriptional regulator [Eggerthellaceae bacterium]